MRVQNPCGRRAAPEPTDPVLYPREVNAKNVPLGAGRLPPITRIGEVSRPESLGGMCHWAKNPFAWKVNDPKGLGAADPTTLIGPILVGRDSEPANAQHRHSNYVSRKSHSLPSTQRRADNFPLSIPISKLSCGSRFSAP